MQSRSGQYRGTPSTAEGWTIGCVTGPALRREIDVARKELVAHDLAIGRRETVAQGLPVGAPPGIAPSTSRA